MSRSRLDAVCCARHGRRHGRTPRPAWSSPPLFYVAFLAALATLARTCGPHARRSRRRCSRRAASTLVGNFVPGHIHHHALQVTLLARDRAARDDALDPRRAGRAAAGGRARGPVARHQSAEPAVRRCRGGGSARAALDRCGAIVGAGARPLRVSASWPSRAWCSCFRCRRRASSSRIATRSRRPPPRGLGGRGLGSSASPPSRRAGGWPARASAPALALGAAVLLAPEARLSGVSRRPLCGCRSAAAGALAGRGRRSDAAAASCSPAIPAARCPIAASSCWARATVAAAWSRRGRSRAAGASSRCSGALAVAGSLLGSARRGLGGGLRCLGGAWLLCRWFGPGRRAGRRARPFSASLAGLALTQAGWAVVVPSRCRAFLPTGPARAWPPCRRRGVLRAGELREARTAPGRPRPVRPSTPAATSSPTRPTRLSPRPITATPPATGSRCWPSSPRPPRPSGDGRGTRAPRYLALCVTSPEIHDVRTAGPTGWPPEAPRRAHAPPGSGPCARRGEPCASSASAPVGSENG